MLHATICISSEAYLETIQFEENSKLKRIISRAFDGVNTSYRSPFEDCTSLKTFDASNCKNEYTIDSKTFSSCSSLVSVIMPQIKELREGDLNSSLVNINIPDVKTITSKAFAHYSLLNNITMTNVESIWNWAFGNCTSIETIAFPNTLKSIGENAFYGCTSLKEVYCKAVTPPTLAGSVFYDVSADIVIYVPEESLDEYKSADKWKDYANHIQGYKFTE